MSLDEIHEVKPGILPAPASGKGLFMDMRRLGPGVKAEAPDAASVTETHREAHGLLPDDVLEVVAGH